MSTADVPSSTTPSVATFSPGRTTKRLPDASCSTGMRASRPSLVEHRDVLGAELEQRLQRRAGAALGARLEVAAEQDERRHDRRDLEVDLRRCRRRARGSARTASACRACPASPRNSAYSDHSHAASTPTEISVSIVAVACRGSPTRPGGTARRPRSRPGVASCSAQPLPVVELQRRDHRHQQDRQATAAAEMTQPPAQRGRLVLGEVVVLVAAVAAGVGARAEPPGSRRPRRRRAGPRAGRPRGRSRPWPSRSRS